MLKAAQCAGDWGHALPVAYRIFQGKLCVFCATESSEFVGTSVGFSEGIIEAIARRENRNISSMRYFDLQTRCAGGVTGSRPQPGDFEFEEVRFVVIGRSLSHLSWKSTICPEAVIETFRIFIDGIPRQQVRTQPQVLKF